MKKYLLALILYISFTTLANAVNCFWVGGTGTWDNSAITHWAPTTGAAATGCQTSNAAPATGDAVTFDASSGGGTVTASATVSGLSLASLTAGAFTGTLDFSANNPNMTFTGSMSLSGSGVRKFLMGTGTFTFTQNGSTPFDLGTVTNLDGTSNFSGATYSYTGNTSFQRNFNGGGRTYGTISIGSNSNRGPVFFSGSNTYTTFTIASGTSLYLGNGNTHTFSNAPTFTGTSSLPISIDSNSIGSTSAISLASGTFSCTWCTVHQITTGGGGTFSATNSLDLGANTGWTITPPSTGGGGGRIIGG